MKYTESGGGYDLTLRYTYDTKGNLTYRQKPWLACVKRENGLREPF